MKTLVNLILFMLLIISGCTNCTKASNDSFKLDFNLAGVQDSTIIQVYPVTHNRKTPPVGECVVINGKATLTGSVDTPTPVFLYFSNGNGAFPMFVENTEITVSGDLQGEPDASREGYFRYNTDNLKVSGSELTPKYHEIYALKKQMGRELMDGRASFEDVLGAIREAHQAGDNAKMEEIKASERYKAYEQFEHDHMVKLENEYRSVISANKDTFWGPVTMLTYYVYFIPEMRPMYEEMSDEAKATKWGKEICKELYPVGRPGDKLADFQSVDPEGNPLSLHTIAKDSKLTLVDFWASWCRPCRAEIPNLKRIYDRFKDKGFNVVSVSIDDEDAAWRKALAKEQFAWPNCRDTEKDIRETYGVASIPMLVVVDSEGKLVVENLRGEALEQKISELLD